MADCHPSTGTRLPSYPRRPISRLPAATRPAYADANSFYVAAIVKPLFPFFPSLTSLLEELFYIALISLYICVLVLRRTGMAMRVSTSQSRDDLYHHP